MREPMPPGAVLVNEHAMVQRGLPVYFCTYGDLELVGRASHSGGAARSREHVRFCLERMA